MNKEKNNFNFRRSLVGWFSGVREKSTSHRAVANVKNRPQIVIRNVKANFEYTSNVYWTALKIDSVYILKFELWNRNTWIVENLWIMKETWVKGWWKWIKRLIIFHGRGQRFQQWPHLGWDATTIKVGRTSHSQISVLLFPPLLHPNFPFLRFRISFLQRKSLLLLLFISSFPHFRSQGRNYLLNLSLFSVWGTRRTFNCQNWAGRGFKGVVQGEEEEEGR